MKYFPRSWNTFKFLISPNEFENIFNEFHHIEYTHRVPKNYIETDPQILFDNYRLFYNKLVSNYKFLRSDDELTNLQMGFSNDLSKCIFGEPFIDETNKQYYKISDFIEPCVGLGIVVLSFYKNKKLFSNRSFIQFPENTIGLQIEFPKEIDYYEENKNKTPKMQNIKTRNCNEIETSNMVYKKITEKIKKTSRNLTFTVDGKEYKTPIKISINIIEEMKNIYFIKNNKCIIK
jgi:hypothetical protein